MKRKHQLKKLLCVMMAVAVLLSLTIPTFAADDETEDERIPMKVEKIDGEGGTEQLREDRKLKEPTPEDVEVNPDEVVRVSIVLEEPSTIAMGYSTIDIAADAEAMSYRDGLQAQQEKVQADIETAALGGEKLDVVWNLTLATNLISANVKRSDIPAIEGVEGVKSVFVERRYSPDVISVGGEKDPDMAVSSEMTNASGAWDTGYTGLGTKIAIIDTGIAIDHQSFDEGAFNYSVVTKQGYDPDKLMDESDVKNVFDHLNISSIEYKAQTANPDKLYQNAKVPYAYN